MFTFDEKPSLAFSPPPMCTQEGTDSISQPTSTFFCSLRRGKSIFINFLNCEGTERCGRQLQVSDGNPCRCSNPDFDFSIEGPFLYQHFPSREPAAAALDDAFAAVVSSKYTWQQLC